MFDLLREGGEIAVLGMGAVFSLLGLLVLTMKGMSGLAALVEGPGSDSGTGELPPPDGSNDPHLTAAVAAAIHAHRTSEKR